MAENVPKEEIKREVVEEEEGSHWWLYILGVIVLVVIVFYIFRGGKPAFLKRSTSQTQAVPTTEVSVTVEATVEQVIFTQNTYFINSLAGFTTLNYNIETTFVDENGVKITSDKIKAGSKLRVEGKPNGKIFEAKKITLLGTKTNVLATPTPNKLPETGIVE